VLTHPIDMRLRRAGSRQCPCHLMAFDPEEIVDDGIGSLAPITRWLLPT
jgi:hypothetical protein